MARSARSAGPGKYYSSLSPVEKSDQPLGDSTDGYAPVGIEDFREDDDDERPLSANHLDYDVPVGHITPTRVSILSFSFLTMTTLSTIITFVPFVITSQSILYDLTNRHYFALPLATMRTLSVACTYLILRRTIKLTHLPASCWPSKREENNCTLIFLVVFWAEVSFIFHGLIVPSIFSTFRDNFFTEPDKTTAIEWRDLEKIFSHAFVWSGLAALVDLCVVVLGISILWHGSGKSRSRSGSIISGERIRSILPSAICYRNVCQRDFSMPENYFDIFESRWLCNTYRRLALFCLLTTLPCLTVASYSAFLYLPKRDPPHGSNVGPYCDPIEETECLMPFPSNFFTREDNSTVTGRRVDISREALSTMYKGGGPIRPSFLNDLDGFSTGGPIVFYLDGMREGGGKGAGGGRLPGPDEIEISLTSLSVTLLLDVDKVELVAHWSEFDTIDRSRPSIVMQQAVPLKHDTAYAVAVVNALDWEGKLLSPSTGFMTLLSGTNEDTSRSYASNERQQRRAEYYRNSLIPAFKTAAPWLCSDDSRFQMLFDFHTASARSQLGTARGVRDGTIQQLQSSTWGNWSDHVQVIKIINRRCRRPKDRIARIVHAELDVPWYLSVDAPRHRASFIEEEALYSDQTPVELVKFVVLVPCSLVNDGANSTNLTAMVDFGHSFLYSRQEVLDSTFLHKMANDNGYILFASNWRGMSRLDLPVILRTFVAEPNLFRAARDNLIQGYAARMAIQHFCKHALLQMDFMQFRPPHSLQRNNQTEVRFFFYGISQGGILGGAYSALSGKTGLLDGAVLGNPGTPFGLLMSKSDIFPPYLSLLLLNLYHRRHVRIVVSLMQMAWDSVEVAGVLAPPVTETTPKTLIQTALGDSTVTTLGAEILARAYGAHVFADGPRCPFGLDVVHNNNKTWGEIQEGAAFTELLYRKDFLQLRLSLNKTKHGGIKHNDVHWCTRLDPALQKQIEEFINNDVLIDPCISDGCARSNATC